MNIRKAKILILIQAIFPFAGLCKAIGVSNFKICDLENLKETWNVVPHVNQVIVMQFSK